MEVVPFLVSYRFRYWRDADVFVEHIGWKSCYRRTHAADQIDAVNEAERDAYRRTGVGNDVY